MNYLLDTNHLSPLVTIGHTLRGKIQARFQAGDTFAIATPVVSEFLFGIGDLPRARQNMQEWSQLKADFVFYPIDTTIAEDAAELRLNARRKGRQITLIDAFNAVIAVRADLVLLTTDKDFLAIAGLKQENWLLG